MKKNTIIILVVLVVAAVLCVVGIKYAADRTEKNMQALFDMPVPEITTTEVEESTEVEEPTIEDEEATTDIKTETAKRYENPFYFKKVQLTSSELPFNFGYPNAVGEVNMYVPEETIGEDTWENTYIVVEHHRSSEVIIKFDEKDDIYTGNLVSMDEMFHGNLTFIYFDGEYSQNYTVDKDGSMLIFKDFPTDVEEIYIKNRSVNPIYVGEISGEKVSINHIIVKITD